MKTLYTVAFLIFISCLVSCLNDSGKKECSASTIINPNGDSELALLMRAMFDDSMQMKKSIEAGKKPVSQINYEELFTAEATVPEKMSTAEYKAFAKVHFAKMAELSKANSEEAPKMYTQMVESCMGCHHSFCPGPIVRIKKLYLDGF